MLLWNNLQTHLKKDHLKIYVLQKLHEFVHESVDLWTGMDLDCSRLDSIVMISVSFYWFSFVRVTSLVLCTHFLREGES